jgi:hypothetical protein
MKKYLGSYMTIYCGIAAVLIWILMLVFMIFLITSKNTTSDDGANFVLVPLCAMFFCIFSCCIFSIADQLFSYGIFEKDRVVVKCPFRKTYVIEYQNIKEVACGFYMHSVLNAGHIGSKVNYIYFAGRKLSDVQKTNLNMLKPSKSFIKFGYSEKTYNYLIETLPDNLSDMLQESYNGLKQQ